LFKIEQFLGLGKWHNPPKNTPLGWEKMASRNGYVTKTYLWNDAYLAALLESDRKKIPARLQAAESAVNERLHALSIKINKSFSKKEDSLRPVKT
jgi:hypothetical protein